MIFKDWTRELDGADAVLLTAIDESEIELAFDSGGGSVALTSADARAIGERLIAFAEWAEDAVCPFCMDLMPVDRGCGACDGGSMTRADARKISQGQEEW